jgi:hypothetical protein
MKLFLDDPLSAPIALELSVSPDEANLTSQYLISMRTFAIA